MAADQSRNQPVAAAEPAGSGMTAAKRRQLQACFERGNSVLQQDKQQPDYDYAHTMFAECVRQDPGNLEYVAAMLDNLQKKYGNNKRGSRFARFTSRGAFKKAVAAEDWDLVFETGIDVLKANPWDVPTLRALANACKANRYNEVELRYLKNALDVNGKDLDVCRHCAETLSRVGQFDQAIALWHRIEEIDKRNDEARRKISELTVAKQRGIPSGLETTRHGAEPKPESPAAAQPTRASRSPIAAHPTEESSDLNPATGNQATGNQATRHRATKAPGINRSATHLPAMVIPSDAVSNSDADSALCVLEERVQSDQATVDDYLALADAYTEANRLRDAFQTLKQGLAASGGGNLRLLEQLEDAQIRMVRQQVIIAEQRARTEGTPEAEDLATRFRAELNRQEIQVLSARCERHPNDLSLPFELAVRLKRDGNYRAARQAFQQAEALAELAAPASLQIGECLQHLKQYSQALKAYQTAIERAQAGSETQKLAMFRTGVLAAALKNWDLAHRSLQQLITMAPDYRDARARLDKIKQIRDSD